MKQKNLIFTGILLTVLVVLFAGVIVFVRNRNSPSNVVSQSITNVDASLQGLNAQTDFEDISEVELGYTDAAETSENKKAVEQSTSSVDVLIKGLNSTNDFADFGDLAY